MIKSSAITTRLPVIMAGLIIDYLSQPYFLASARTALFFFFFFFFFSFKKLLLMAKP